MTEPVIRVDNLWFSYSGRSVFEGIDLQVQHGDFIAMIGPNGGGKTTLMKILLGLLKPTAGLVRVFGSPPATISHRIGYVPQEVLVHHNLPVSTLDVVLMGTLKPGRIWVRYSSRQREAARRTLSQMDMEGLEDKPYDSLSGGQRQRVMIARALVSRPELMLLDEPTASIDNKGRHEFYRLLKELNKEITILIVSHDIMILAEYVKSVLCVNHRLHYHDQREIVGGIGQSICPCSVEELCPVKIMGRGL
jgi:zinc transport system ATP-binding protein